MRMLAKIKVLDAYAPHARTSASLAGFALLTGLLHGCGESASRQSVNIFEPHYYGTWDPTPAPPPDCAANLPHAVIHASSPDGDTVQSDITGHIRMRPLQTLQLSARLARTSPASSSTPARARWRIAQRPAGSTITLEAADQLNTSLWMQLAGRYTLELDVWDSDGRQSCTPAHLAIDVVPDADLHLQLVWHTPGDEDETDRFGADLDLHLLHPNARGQWDHPRWDCYWTNPTPNWGDLEHPAANPTLDIDDIDGAGPENINLKSPEAGLTYRVGVFYHSDHGFGPSYATVRIYVRGELVLETEPHWMARRERWEVADISWPSGKINRLP